MHRNGFLMAINYFLPFNQYYRVITANFASIPFMALSLRIKY